MATTTKTKKAPAKPKVVKEPKVKTASSMELPVFNMAGAKVSSVTLPENIFGLNWNADLVHQVVTGMQANARTPVAHTKDRSEVRGGGRKPWQQKGTGRARHGSSRSPIWKGGGVTHGPRNEKDYSVKINRQARQKALLVTLSRKLRDGEVILMDSLSMNAPKAKEAKGVLVALGKAGLVAKSANNALIALPNAHTATQKSFANLKHVEVIDVRNLNPVSVLTHKYLVIADPSAAIETLSKKKVVKTDAK
jgi:large subunit ribosomal protein L4